MTTRNVLDVGQCGFDHSRISFFLKKNFDVEIVQAHSHDEAVSLAADKRFDLILINRLLDADQAPGIEILKAIRSADTNADVPVMLVSNFQDAQDQAVAEGAVAGFGKANLDSPETQSLLGQYLG